MNYIEKDIYESIKEMYYKFLNNERIRNHVKENKVSGLFYSRSCWVVDLESKALHEKYVDELLKIYCGLGDKITIEKSLPKNRRILYRGVQMPKQAYLKNLNDGVYAFHRYGAYGMGQYLAYDRRCAEQYTTGKKENVLEVYLQDDMNVVKCSYIEGNIKTWVKELEEDLTLDRDVVKFIKFDMREPYILSVFAGAYGYNAIIDDYGDIACAIKPSRLIYKDEGILDK